MTPPHTGRPRSGAISIPGGPGVGGLQDILARREIDAQRERNLREMFAGTELVTKTSAQAKRAKELAEAAKKATTEVTNGLRRVNLPTVNLTLPGIPDVSIPSLNLPGIDLPRLPSLPNLNLPSVTLPRLPGLDLPEFDLPNIDVPDLSLPSINLPGIGDLNLEIPGIRTVLQLLIDLFDGLDLPSIIIEIGAPEILLDFIGAALPVLGQLKSGAQAASEWGKAAKKGYQIYKVSGQKQLILSGDPRAAVDAVKTLLIRAGAEHTAKASIKTTQFATSSAGLALDAGAISGPLISAAAALATLCLKVYSIGIAYKEKQAGNLALKQPEQLNAQIFSVSPTLGCYLLTCSNTSDVINVLTADIGAKNWNINAELMKRKIDPLLLEATKFIKSSPYELKGLKQNKGTFTAKKKGLLW